ncbi:MAG: insulinase family protein [Sandaracinaceae bacterium]|nr:insulinase family protein [Sandaracinaceae bacterium]
MMRRALVLACALALASCGSQSPTSSTTPEASAQGDSNVTQTETARVAPPVSGPARDVHFPPIQRTTTANGLEVNVVATHALPVLYVRLVIKSGDATDPAGKPGMAHFVARMMQEGTTHRSSARLAEDVEFLGADLSIGSDEENVYVEMRALSDQLPAALEILADVALNPAFSDTELRKFKRRELDRLTMQLDDPSFLAQREFYRAAYGDHPYAHVDATPESVNALTRQDLVRWHHTNFVPNNAFVVVVGDTTQEAVATAVTQVLGRWRQGEVPETTYAAPPTISQRRIILVDRPESVQSVVTIGNLALRRSSPDYIKLVVANQVLGGSAASRLFMDLRERRSLTYGAYSGVGERVEMAPFRASASVRNEVTEQAVSAFMEHLHRIVTDAPPQAEIADAQRYLSDSFPLRIDTAGKIADMVADLRVYGLPDDYWDSYRTQIRAVTPGEALQAAQTYIHPDASLMVVVGRATAVLEALRHYGPVTVVDIQGHAVSTHDPL